MFSLIIRLINLSSPPPFGDELDVGNQSYSLLHTLRDYKGNFLPTYLQSFSESRAPLLMYFSLPSIALLGQTSLGVRLPSVIFSLLALFFFFKLVHHLTHQPYQALLATLVLSTSLTFFHYSHFAFESTLLVFLLITATYLFLTRYYLFSLVLFALTFYTYNTANIFTPLLVGYLFFTQRPRLSLFSHLIIPTFLLLPFIFQIIFGHASNRFSLISIFTPQVGERIEVKRSTASNPYSLGEKLFHNKPVYFLKDFASNYLTAISPSTIFLQADPNPRHSLPEYGFFLLPLALAIPFIFFSKPNSIFLFWLLISPIASSLTQGGGQHATRLFLILPSIAYLLTHGLVGLYHRTRPLFFITFALTTYFFLGYLHEFYIHYPNDQYLSWGYGYEQLFSSVPHNSSKVLISNPKYNLLSPYVFYHHVDPKLLQTNFSDQSTPILSQQKGYCLSQTCFVTDWGGPALDQITALTQKNDVVILTQLVDIPGDMLLNHLPQFTLLNTIYDPYHLPLYQVIQRN